jgi:MFS transporter, ACS family, glucarate transporter
MSVAGERMMRDLGLTQVQLGVVLAGFAWGYALFQLPGGLLGERLGGRKALTLIAVAWGVLNVTVALVPGASGDPLGIIIALTAVRFLMGAAQAPLYPISGGQAIARWFPPDGWALPNGLLNAGLTLGSAATGPLIAWLATTLGWRASFIVTAPLGLAIGWVWWWYARDQPDQHPGTSARELAMVQAGRRNDAEEPMRSRAWTIVLRDRNVLLIAASYFCSNYVFYFFFNWLYIYLVDVRGFAALKGGAFAAAPWIAGAVGATLGGVACDRISRRYGLRWGPRVVSMAGLMLAGVFIIAAGRASSPYVAVVLLCLCLASQQLTDSAAWAATTAVGGRHSAAACGVLNTGGNVVGGIGALLVPVTARDLGWPAALGIASLFAVVGAILWVWIDADHPADARD